MKTLAFFALAALPFCLFSQTEKGAQPLKNPQSAIPNPHSTRAVVVGISDYQSPQIPDLKFADRDAIAFSDWLKSAAGGGIPTENVRLLLNEKAKNAQLVAELDGLAEEAKEGDLVIIYFSGHGDVETKTRGQFGFLLAWDSPPTNYKAGAYPLIFLQDIVSTITDKKARVIVIADACHAGKLAGSSIGGTQATAQTLAQQFSNEVKILSCQPNELSLEGEQWGRGRGAFSYNLIAGLTGEADRNGDKKVNLHEIDRFLGEVVPEQTAPHSQIPMVVGDKQFVVAAVDQAAFEKWMDEKAPFPLAATSGKGMADGLLEAGDSALAELYLAFENALEKGPLLEGDGSANALFERLSKEEKLRSLHGLMRRNFAAALQNEPQQALNKFLEGDPDEANNWAFSPQKMADFPRQLRRSIELLGEKHYMFPTLRAKELYFEGLLIAKQSGAETAGAAFQDSVRALAKAKWLAAIALEPQAAYLFYSIGNLFYRNNPPRTDSLKIWCERAIERAPQWVLPYLEIAFEGQVSANDAALYEKWTLLALEIAPESYPVLERLSWMYQWQNRTDESLAISEKMIALRPDLFNAYSTAGVTSMMRKEFTRAEAYFEKSLALEPSPNNWAKPFGIQLLIKMRRASDALKLVESIRADSLTSPEVLIQSESSAASGFFQIEDFENASFQLEKMQKNGPIASFNATVGLLGGICLIEKGQFEKGLAEMKRGYALELNFINSDVLLLRYQAKIAERTGFLARADSFYRAAMAVLGRNVFALNDRLDCLIESAQKDYALFLLAQNREKEAVSIIETMLAEEPLSWRGPFCMALFQSKKGDRKAALDWLEKSLDRWLPTREMIEKEALFSKIRKTKRFGDLMKKHFPTSKN